MSWFHAPVRSRTETLMVFSPPAETGTNSFFFLLVGEDTISKKKKKNKAILVMGREEQP